MFSSDAGPSNSRSNAETQTALRGLSLSIRAVPVRVERSRSSESLGQSVGAASIGTLGPSGTAQTSLTSHNNTKSFSSSSKNERSSPTNVSERSSTVATTTTMFYNECDPPPFLEQQPRNSPTTSSSLDKVRSPIWQVTKKSTIHRRP